MVSPGRKKRNENKLRAYHSAKRQTGEDVHLFALRLEQLAEQAFPGVNMKEHESLRTAFILSLPYNVQNKIREFIIQNEMCTQTRVPWDKLVLLADSYDREFHPWKNIETIEKKEESSVNLSRDNIEIIQIDNVVPQATWSEILKGSSHPRVERPRYQKSIEESRTLKQRPKTIHKSYTYCGRTGHTVDECYKALGICSYCKTKGHIRNDCWHYTKDNSPPRGNNNNNRKSPLECPFCKGDHLGINCNSRRSTQSNKNPHNSPSENSFRNLPVNNNSPPQGKNNTPLPQRIRSNSRTFENSTLSQDPWVATGAKPKTKYIEHCNMCGDSHYEGKCLGDSEN